MSAPLDEEERPVELLLRARDAVFGAIRRADIYVNGDPNLVPGHAGDPEDRRIAILCVADAQKALAYAVSRLMPDEEPADG